MTAHDRISPARELHLNVSVPFERAHAMPKSVYTSPEFLAQEQRHIFAKDWICAGRAETLPNPGDYLTLTLAEEPVIVLRDRDGSIKAMSNVCGCQRCWRGAGTPVPSSVPITPGPTTWTARCAARPQ